MPAAVELRDVVKSFRAPHGIVEAVRGIDVEVPAGESVALLGPNGAGKSTSIDMVLGLTRPDRGTVTVLGRPAREAVEAGRVTAMLQTGALAREVTVRELVALVCALHERSLPVDEVLEVAGITDIAGRRTERLSGGQAQRVRFAMALAPDPDVLVLDEPTVGMDVSGRRAFWTSMRGFTERGRTILFATHYLDEAESYADRTVLMARGRIVADGPTAEVRARVGRRTIRCTLPGAQPEALAALPGVAAVERHEDAVALSCTDSDAAIRALLGAFPAARDIEIAAPRLEEAFVELTAETAA